MIIVGSRALVHSMGNVRVPKDIDMFATEEELQAYIKKSRRVVLRYERNEKKNKLIAFCTKNVIIECELTDKSALNKAIHDRMLLDSKDKIHATLEWLYFLKMSHRYLKNSVHFLKTMQDIHLLRTVVSGIPAGSQELFEARVKETYTYNHPNLSVEKSQFFNKEESFYVYDHDTIHEAVAIGERPAYTYYIADGEQVKCDKDKFFSIDESIRLNGVLEEAYVLALERSHIPHNFKLSGRQAFNIALEKVCTSVTSGWFREYAWENYFKVQNLYSVEYITKFKKALEEGKILPFNREIAIY